jgi:AhpD family alkylhydroperoxidase
VSLVTLVEYGQAGPEVRAVYDDIMRTRGVDWVNNFWKALAHDPALLRRTWESVKQVMAPGALDPLVKEMVYVAVSATNGCEYCTYSHTAGARAKGMSEAMFMELMAVVPTPLQLEVATRTVRRRPRSEVRQTLHQVAFRAGEQPMI